MRFFEKNQEVILQWNCKSFMKLQPGEIIRRSLSEITLKWKLLYSFWWSNQCWTKRHEKYFLCTFSKFPAVCQVKMQENSLHFLKITTCWGLKESGGKFLHAPCITNDELCAISEITTNAFLKWPSESLYYVEESVERFFFTKLEIILPSDFLHNS